MLQAKQRASVRWLVAKAYNNQVPTNLREPYYRDQTDVSRFLPFSYPPCKYRLAYRPIEIDICFLC